MLGVQEKVSLTNPSYPAQDATPQGGHTHVAGDGARGAKACYAHTASSSTPVRDPIRTRVKYQSHKRGALAWNASALYMSIGSYTFAKLLWELVSAALSGGKQ